MSSSEGASQDQQLGQIRSDVRHLESDVTDLRAEVRVVSQKVDTLRVELGGRIDKLKEETRQDLKEMRQDLKETRQDVKGLREEFYSFKVDVTREFGAVRTEMRTEFQAVRTAIEASKRWMIVAGAGMISTALGALAALGRVMKWF